MRALSNLLIVTGSVALTVLVFSWLFSVGFYGEGESTFWEVLGAWITFAWPSIVFLMLGGFLYLLALEIASDRLRWLTPRAQALLFSPISAAPFLAFILATVGRQGVSALYVAGLFALLLALATRR
jgi:hypothetical protein